MALRANLKHAKEPSLLKRLVKWVALVLGTLTLLCVAFILYFNGQNVKAPLLKFLEGRTSFTMNCEKVEFSPLYPNVLKLTNLRFNKSKIGEIYVEYDLPSLLTSDTLELKEFYARQVQINKEDLDKFSEEKFNFKDIIIHKLNLIDTSLHFEILKAKNSEFIASEVHLSEAGELSFKEGSIKFEEGVLDGNNIKKFKAQVKFEPEKISIEDLSMNLFGGTIMCDASIDRESKSINFSRLNLINTIFLNLKDFSEKYRLFAQEASASNCVLSLPKYDLLLGQVTGTVYDLFVGNGSVSFDFEGNAGEISKPNAHLSADNSDMVVSVKTDEVSLKLNGNIFDGKYSVDATITGFNQKEQDLSVKDFSFKGGKLEPNEHLYKYLHRELFAMNTFIGSARIGSTEFVSHIDSLPLSVKEISFEAKNLKFERVSNSIEAENGKVIFGFNSAFYLDLYIGHLESILSLNEDEVTFSIPDLTLQKSKLSLSTSFDRDFKNFSALINAKDFDTGELNSSLFNNLFNGKLTLTGQVHTIDKDSEKDEKTDADAGTATTEDESFASVKETTAQQDNLINRLEGSFRLTSDGLLISNLGLDLINGGIKKDYVLDLSSFLNAIKGSDLVIYKLNSEGKLLQGNLKTKLSGDLTSSHVTLNSDFDLNSSELISKATLVSLPKDSISFLSARGNPDSLKFYITALTRGEEIRPGINIDEPKTDETSDNSSAGSVADDNKDVTEAESKVPDNVELSEDNISISPHQNDKSAPPATTIIHD